MGLSQKWLNCSWLHFIVYNLGTGPCLIAEGNWKMSSVCLPRGNGKAKRQFLLHLANDFPCMVPAL